MRFHLRRLIVLFIFFVIPAGLLRGLEPQKKITQYTFKAWKSDSGLPNNSVLAIAQDRSGFLWLGTAEGLVRFDGAIFTVFNSRNTPGFQDNFVNNLYLDRRGVLWIGTMRGKLLSLERGRFRAHFLADDVSRISNYCIAEDGQGDLWVGTSSGLFHRQAGQDGPLKKYRGFSDAGVMSLAVDGAGRLLVSVANRGLYRLEKGEWRRILPDLDSSANDIYVIRPERRGDLWIGTENGLYRYRDGRRLDFSPGPGLNSLVTALVEDRDGNLWVGSESGLFRWRNGDWQSLSKSKGLDSDFVYAVCEDAEGSVWLGALDGGLVQIRDEKITTFTDREGLSGGKFRCLYQDDAGALWVGGAGGKLCRYRDGRCQDYELSGFAKNHTIYSLEPGADGSLWLGASLGLFRFQNGRGRKMALPGEKDDIEVRCVKRDPVGRLWIGTWGRGVFCLRNGEFTSYAAADGLPGNRVSSLHVDRGGSVWAGCENGLAVMKPGTGGRFSTEPFLNGCYVTSFFEDDQASLWIGTQQGIKVRREGRWGSLNTDQGLFDSRVYVIQEDGQDCLWLSSERGIFRARKDELEKAAFDKNLKVSGRLFDENDGMKSRICNYGNPAGWKDETGRLWFANLAGVVSIDPAHIRKNMRVPPVLVEDVIVDNRNLPTAGNSPAQLLQLAAGSKRFEFKYTALSFIRSDKIAFKYKLEGYDKEWTEAGNRREAFYNDLRPGRYNFRVIAANADGVWNLAGASFAFFLRPFVYQTWWFMVLAALAFMALSVLLWQLLKKYLLAVNFWKKKTQIGHFKILETLGTGGMATVYKAQDMLDKKRIVALKVLKEENFHDENQKKRFKHESLITEQLDHPHIVHIIERGEMADCWYIAMELLHGRSLARVIRDEGRLEIATALDIMLQVVDALRAIHGQNIVHRDLKPENIMVSERRGRPHFVKLLDFGLAITPAQSRLTMSGVVMGTIRYLPPERISDGTSSPAGDIYSAGIILYEMLTGSKPFWSEATGEVIHRILETYPLAAGQINPLIPLDLEALIKAMIDKEPVRRPALAAVEGELRRLAEKFPGPPETEKS
jgi:ligand-binding sensor domain-containing protein/tRNA A-37 threonylcarbamoyl transferase component Bud32